jgi:MHS family shikimate/dehydroshikimate transporter-like MFS transporter
MNKDILKITAASAIGTLFEWYDFLIYGVAAALVFNTLFFPNVSSTVGLLAALLTYAVGFVARPVGGAIFGHYGDRLGRRSVLTITMLLMGISTVGIGLLPTWDSIGIWAPVGLVSLRILQGIGFGGEWGSAALMILENAPANRRGFYSSFVQIGFPLGLLLATGIFALLSQLPHNDLIAWGWRVPFLFSFVLILIGSYVRSQLTETPVFQQLQLSQSVSKNPFWETVVKNPRILLTAVGIKLTEVSWSYVVTIFLVGYATNKLSLPKSTIMNAIAIASAVNLVAIPAFGYLSDLIGRKPLFYLGSAFTVAFAFPLFSLIESGAVNTAIIAGMLFGNAMMFSTVAAYLSELFPPQIRSTGLSFSNQLAAAIGGGLAPTIATTLAIVFGGSAGASVMMICFAITTAIATFVSKPA